MPGSLYATRQRQSGRWIGGGGRRMRSQACCKPPSSYPSPSSRPVISVGANYFNIFYICMYVLFSILELTSSCRYIKSQLKGQASLIMKSKPIFFQILFFFFF
ncbi:hypothetical protein ABFS82_08G123800 [Erythranthe guttata]